MEKSIRSKDAQIIVFRPQGIKIMENHFKTMRKFKDGLVHYDFKTSIKYLEIEGKKRFGDHFSIHPQDHSVLYKLLVYAIGDKENMLKQGMDTKRGLLVSGPVGCGKTSLLNLLNNFFPLSYQYPVLSSREVVFRFIREGYSVIHTYGMGCYRFASGKHSPKTVCFDDLGVEQSIKYYGNDCNVMAEILLSRYDQFVKSGMLTHVTTNLSATELEELYGNRLRSRMREMFNLVSFDKGIKDKRI